MSSKALTVLGLLFCALTPALRADEASAKRALGVQAAQALEAALPSLYPGSHLVWSPQMAIVASDGTSRPVRLQNALKRQDSNGFTFVFPIEFPADQDKARIALEKFEPGTPASLTDLATVRTGMDFSVIGVRRGLIPETAAFTQMSEMQLAPDEYGGALEWPQIYVAYAATYGTPDWFGTIGWEAKIATETVTVLHRLPASIRRQGKTGSVMIEVPIIIPSDDLNSFDLISRRGARIVTQCAVPCVPDGRVLLGLW